MRFVSAFVSGALLCGLPFAVAESKEPAPLRGRRIDDRPTTVSVPLDDRLSLVLPLRERFWHMAPRHSPNFATSLDGAGLILQYLNDIGGSVSMCYTGAVAMPEAQPEEQPKDRAARAARAFAADLAKKYKRVGWTITTSSISLREITIRVMGKPLAAWRSAPYMARPDDYQGPESVFQCACLLFQPPGVEKLCYIALDFKGGGTTLDAVIENLDVKPTRGLFPKGRRVQLNDLVESSEGRYPVRLLAFDMPPKFVPTPMLASLRGEWLFAEERLPDGDGWADGFLTIRGESLQRGDDAKSVAERLRARSARDGGGSLEEVPLGVDGHVAWLFAHPAANEPPGTPAHSAVLVLDDQVLTITLVSRGSARLAASDREALTALLRGVQMAVRW